LKWTVLETLVSPETGMAFTLVVSANNNKFILWHLYCARITSRKPFYVHAGMAWVYQGERIDRIQIYRVTLYCNNLWENLKKHAGCEKYITDEQCTLGTRCSISPCPRNLR